MDVTQQQINAAREDFVQLLLKELKEINDKIDVADDDRKKSLRIMSELAMQYDGVIKQLDLMGHDVTAL